MPFCLLHRTSLFGQQGMKALSDSFGPYAYGAPFLNNVNVRVPGHE
jgi:hypothetical protein